MKKSTNGSPGEGDGGDVGMRSSLEVTVPSELEGVAYIQVEVKTVPGRWEMTQFSSFYCWFF